jgi:hypothetical protein
MSEKIDKQHRSTGQVATLRGKHHRLKERNMHRRILFLMIVASFATGLVGQRIYAQDRSDHLLIKGVTDAKVTLQQGHRCRTTRATDFGKIRGRGREAPAFRLHSKGREVL